MGISVGDEGGDVAVSTTVTNSVGGGSVAGTSVAPLGTLHARIVKIIVANERMPFTLLRFMGISLGSDIDIELYETAVIS